MKQGLLTLAGIALAVAAALPAHADLTSSIQNFNQRTFNLAQAYPCTIQGYRVGTADEGISDLRVWGGVCGNNDTILPPGTLLSPPDDDSRNEPGGTTADEVANGDDVSLGPEALVGATPANLCLARNGLALDVNCFAVASTANGQFPPCFVQAFRLIKQVPGSFKCPDVFGLPHFDGKGNLIPFQFFQFGNGVRTWWALNFTQPGTKFILEVVSVCRSAPTSTTGVLGPAVIHKDTWTWRVVASPLTLLYEIFVMHGSAVGTLEVPCIIGEDMFDALIKAQARLADAVNSGSATDIGNAIFDMEALIVSNCLFVDVLDPLQVFPGAMQFGAPNIQPPGNLAQTVAIGNSGSAIAGIIDTIENPCCCKLLVDLEWIAIKNGIIGQTPTLPTF